MQLKKRRKNTMTVTRTLDTSKPFKFTEEQLAELAALKKIPGEPDEDCPELTDEQLDQMIEARNRRLALQRKKVVSVRLSAEAILKAKAFGKGYTALLSQILEKTLADDELLKRLNADINGALNILRKFLNSSKGTSEFSVLQKIIGNGLVFRIVRITGNGIEAKL